MLKAIWTKLWANRFRKKTISDILSLVDSRETLLGTKRQPIISDEQNKLRAKSEAGMIVKYSESKDYSVWAGEAWKEAVSCMQRLSDPRLSDAEAHFYRGSFSSIMDMLKISHQARQYLEQQAAQAVQSNGVLPRNQPVTH